MYENIKKVVDDVMKAAYAREIAMYASMGVSILELCANPREDKIIAQVQKMVRKIVNPVLATINKISMMLSLMYMMKQAWDAIPTWDEIKTLVESEVKKVVITAMRAAITEAISVAVCGSQFQKLSISQFSGMVSDELVLTSILVALKTAYEAYEQ